MTFIKKKVTLANMKTKSRSTVGKGLNLSTRVEKQGKGRGAYSRKKEKFVRLNNFQEGNW